MANFLDNEAYLHILELIEEIKAGPSETIDISEIMLSVYPVGSIYMSANPTDPSSLFGGTWIAWGKGKVPVGVDTAQTEFSTVEKTGGSKDVQSHTHRIQISDSHSHTPAKSEYDFLTFKGTATYDIVGAISGTGYRMHRVADDGNGEYLRQSKSSSYSLSVDKQSGSYGAGSSGNLQPYITCYMFKRTA